MEPDLAALWEEVCPLLDPTAGVLVIDDSTLDKPLAKHIELVSHHWATNHLGMAEDTRRMFAELSWGIEEYPTGD